ncbi:putative DNA repair protein Nse1 [Tirmania nivea]|nr:putative DNA repair protein Nse1 [Tirmania nivea]
MASDANKAFIQAFLARRILTLEEAQPILAAILTASGHQNPTVSQNTLNNFITTANNQLSPFDFHIRTLPSQSGPPESRTLYYILTNTTSDSLMQLATTHSAEEISFFRRILDSMFETNNTNYLELCAIRSMEAVRLHKPHPREQLNNIEDGAAVQTQSTHGLTMKEAESTLAQFVSEGWLELSPAGFYSLSPRSIAELQRYLVDTYNLPDEDGVIVEKVKSCHGCKELVTIGLRCDNSDCPIRFHDGCAERLWRVNKSRKCPSCGGNWSSGKYVGERAAKGAKKRVEVRRSIGGGQSIGSQLSAANVRRGVEELEKEDVDSD